MSCTRCGDFICELCAPDGPEPLCARCASRGVVEWEAAGEKDAPRALWSTFVEGVSAPRSLGARLTGGGQLGAAFSYGAWLVLLGALPLCLALSALQLTMADPWRLGLRSTSVLSHAVIVALCAPLAATVLPGVMCSWALLVSALSRLARAPVQFERLARAAIYGASVLGVPLLGPVLLPVALLQVLLAMHGQLSNVTGGLRAAALLFVSLIILLAPWLVLLG